MEPEASTARTRSVSTSAGCARAGAAASAPGRPRMLRRCMRPPDVVAPQMGRAAAPPRLGSIAAAAHRRAPNGGGNAMPSMTVDGYELSYVESGAGDPLVLVHGTLGDQRY